MDETGNLEVEARIVYEYDAVRFPVEDFMLARVKSAQDLADVCSYCDVAHVCKFGMVVVLDLCLCVLNPELPYQTGCV